MLFKKILECVEISKRIAISSNEFFLLILSRIFVSRIFYGFGLQDFVLFDFNRLKISDYKTYMKKMELQKIQIKVNSSKYIHLADDKISFYDRCVKFNLPTPEVLGIICDGSNKSIVNIPIIYDTDTLFNRIDRNKNGSYIIKPSDGSHGEGLMKFDIVDRNICDENGNPLNLKTVIDKLLKLKKSFILQKCLKPHFKLKKIMPNDGLGTFRIITINTGNEVKVVMAFIKIPVGDNVSDNFNAGKSKNLVASVDLVTHKLLNPVGPNPQNLGLIKEVLRHPDNDEILPGFEISQWDELIETVIAGAKAFDELYTIGWDVALSEDGPTLIEANWRYDCDLPQVALRRGMKKEFTDLLTLPAIN